MSSASSVWSQFRPSHDLLWQLHQSRQKGASERVVLRLRAKVVEVNQGLVVKQATRFQQICREPLEDLVQIGNLGLIASVDEFDPTLGNSFSSYAVPKIVSAIQHYLRDRGWGCVRPPRRVVEQYAAVQKAKREAEKLGRMLTLEETAEGCGINREQWQWIVQARSNRPPVSVEDEAVQIAADEPEDSPELEREWVLRQWAALPEPQRSIVAEKFFAGKSITQIARRRRMGFQSVQLLIDQAVSQIRQQAGVV